MANGFIQTQGRLEIEKVGDDIFQELLRLSFFQDTKEDDYGSIQTCQMHDLMHDLACSVMMNECLTAKVGEVKGVLKTIRHLKVVPDEQSSTVPDCVMTFESSLRTLFFFVPINFHSFKFSTSLRELNLKDMGLTTLPKSICQLQHLRYLDLASNSLKSLPEFICRLRNLQMLDLSWNQRLKTLPLSTGTLQHLRFLNLSSTSITSSMIDRISNLENLRYLGLSNCELSTSLPESTGRLKNLQRLNLSNNGITSLPVSIGNMESLRYLDLSGCINITTLPESVGGLRNLQSLILSGCYSLEVLVKSMRNMSSLRHLDLGGNLRLTKMPVGLGESTCLQTLKRFVVGADSECGGINELQGLNQLRGELEIKRLENVRNGEDAKEAKLSSKRFLKELVLRWGNVLESKNSKEVLEGLLVQPPPNLQKLNIYDYPGACFPQGIQHLTSLRSLSIGGCKNLRNLEIRYCKNLTSLEGLSLYYCSELELETEDFQHLTSLGELQLWELPKLRALPLPHHLTMLQYLEIRDCKNLTSLSKGLQYLTSLKSLGIFDCSELELETQDFQHLTSLRELRLQRLPKLRALPLPQHPTMLQYLHILYCKNLTRLPHGIQHLTTLQSLSIQYCHEDLYTRYHKGDDWHLISHIPRTTII